MTMRRWFLPLLLALATTVSMAADENTTATAEPSAPPMKLWPETAPGALGNRDVDTPTLTPWLAPEAIATGAAMIVLPGGGYHTLAPYEGDLYARWLNTMGISAFVLKYRLGSNGYRHPVMLQDAARAMRLIRTTAEQWNVNPGRIGVIGSSAGGHLASMLLTHFDAGDEQSTDVIERRTSRPDLAILCYPVITTGKHGHKGSQNFQLGEDPPQELLDYISTENHVTSSTPPTFIFHTADDTVVDVENALMFSNALAAADVPFELHIYPHGKHGLGLGTRQWEPQNFHPWTKAAETWLKTQNFARTNQ